MDSIKKINKPDVNKPEILSMLGYKSGDLERYEKEIEIAYDQVYENSNIKYVYRQFPYDDLKLVGADVKLDNPDLVKLLENCTDCIIIALTLGLSIDNHIRKTQVLDLAKAIIHDACASSMIESITESVYMDLKEEYLKSGLYFTQRFSPGYGLVPIELNQKFSNFLDTERKIGLKVSGSGLMIPRKSIIAIWGLSSSPSLYKYDRCSDCRLRFNCTLKESGEYCARKY